MTRVELEHIIRAAASIAQSDRIIVIGSQSILGRYPDAPAELRVSMEADVYPADKPEAWNIIDGAIGEGSPFHETFGYYAQGVGPETATLAPGWQSRLISVHNENTRGATGLCLSPEDLVLAKCAANREKDRAFVRAVFAHRLLNKDLVLALLPTLPVTPEEQTRIGHFLSSCL